MSAQQELHSYVSQIERRLRLGAVSRGAAVVASVALGATIVLVLIASAFAFSDGSVTGSRLALFTILALAAIFGLGFPLWRLTRRRAVAHAEARFPEFQQRLVTFTEKQRDADGASSRDPFVELLAAETLDVAAGAKPDALVPTTMLLASAGVGLACLGVLVWMIVARPGFLGYGANLLWTGSQGSAAPLYDLRVAPGDATLRRHTDQLITAQPVGFLNPRVTLYARYHSASKWEPVDMRPRSGASGYQFVLTGVPEDVEYYVEAGPRRSPHYTLRVVDLPAVKQITVTLHYPSWTGLKDEVNERGGDLRALEGTRADLDVVTDRPMTDGLLALDNGQQIKLADGGANAGSNHYRGVIDVDRDGLYHVAAMDHGQPVRLSEDFFIEARKPNAPVVAISRPGNDYRASPIEEVTVAAHAQGEFGLQEFDLHYSVNGGPEKSVRMLKQAGEKESSGATVLPLEEYKLVPGDVISVYANAKDAKQETRTDMWFIQVDPFEREFSQSQQMGGGGGGGGGGNQPGEISQREKEMIASTFRQQGDKKATAKQAAETGKFLSEAQAALRDQSLSLAGRLSARELTSENREFSTFEEEMKAAADAMSPASQKLQSQKWQDAIPDEQKALQHLLRAEATFRQIEVAFGARGGGGGGGAGRDLASLFDLELDMEKNQYETQQTASSQDQRARDINDALKKLDELARRQEDLAQRQRNDSVQSAEQRWQQEMLQREAQELQRQVEQLTRDNAARGAQGQSGSQGSQAQGSQANAGQNGAAGESASASASGRGQAGQRGAGGRQAGAGQSGQAGDAGDENGAGGSMAANGANGLRPNGANGANGLRPNGANGVGRANGASGAGANGLAGANGAGGANGAEARAQSAADARARATQQAAQQALDRLRQAQDDMRRAAADPQRSAEARRAAERLREASSLLGGAQSGEANSRLGSITHEADRLTAEQRAQSERVKQLKTRANGTASGDAANAQSVERDLQQLATDRQRLADDLTNLEQNMRNAARELDAGQRAASDKLRAALEGADQADLETRLQRTADWLRSGVDPNNNGTESQIATDLQHFNDQVRQAQQALTAGGRDGDPSQRGGAGADDTEAALNRIDNLRRQLQALGGANGTNGANGSRDRNGSGQGGQSGQPGQPGQPGQSGQDQQAQGRQNYQTGALSRNGGADAANPQGDANSRGGAASGNAMNGGNGGAGRGDAGPIDGPVGQLAPGSGYRDGTVYDNVDIGNNARGSGRAASAQATPTIDRQQVIQQGVAELTRLRQQAQAQNDPETLRQIQSLITAMEHLDLKRFPGRPEAIDELQQRVLTGVDTLELRLRQNLDDQRTGQVRSTDPSTVPAGYEDAVADYFRRLSTVTTPNRRANP